MRAEDVRDVLDALAAENFVLRGDGERKVDVHAMRFDGADGGPEPYR